MTRRSVSTFAPPSIIAGLLVLSVFATQTAFATFPQAATPDPTPTITVPAGTAIPLTLVSPIKSKSTKVGDSVRAVVAFPITAGAQIAIPAGTYVEGVVASLTPQTKRGGPPAVAIHFTRLLYTNGYTASLDAANTARNEAPGTSTPDTVAASLPPSGFGSGRTNIAFEGGEGFTSQAQTTAPPALPPLPTTGRNVVIGLGIGSTVLLVTAILFGAHRRRNEDDLLFDAGWQFQMSLTSPLQLDTVQAAAAAAVPSH